MEGTPYIAVWRSAGTEVLAQTDQQILDDRREVLESGETLTGLGRHDRNRNQQQATGRRLGMVSGDVEIGFVRNAKGNITVFSVPGAYQSAATGTSPECINTAGVIGGNYDDSTLALHGFVRDAKGKVTKFHPPSSVFTNVTAINTGGTVTGYYQLSSHLLRGFLRTADGTIKTFTVSGSGSKKGQGTIVRAIDDAGDVTGYYVDGRNAYHGFLRSSDGTITTFNAPGAGKGSS